ncbi:TonB-dependent siderophore receptor [Acinetobacter puyangensis]|uniref:TonB-dependent siderophore receptor n=1 Tax=Acinetobacter puyangensis TaxID=1096779 RepID=UPI003A4D79B9
MNSPLYTWNHTGKPVKGQKISDINYNVTQKSIFAVGKFSLTNSLKTILGMNIFDYDYVYSVANPYYNYYTNQPMSDSSVTSPYAAVIYDLNPENSLYLSYTTVYKVQSSQDRYGNTLEPREGANYELGLKSELLEGKVNTSAAVYYLKQDNLAVADTGYIVPGTTNTAAYRAVQGATTKGVDLELNGEVLPDWKINLSYNYNITDDSNGERIKTTSPRNLAKLWTTYKLPNQWNKFTIGGGVNWQSKVYFSTSPWQIGKTVLGVQEDYATVDLMGRYDLNKDVSLSLNLNNVFDKKYMTLDDTFLTGYYGNPRNFLLSLKYKF